MDSDLSCEDHVVAAQPQPAGEAALLCGPPPTSAATQYNHRIAGHSPHDRLPAITPQADIDAGFDLNLVDQVPQTLFSEWDSDLSLIHISEPTRPD